MEQSAEDMFCLPSAFSGSRPVILKRVLPPEGESRAKKYYKEPISCNLITYGANVVASVREDLLGVVTPFLESRPAWACFETPAMNLLQDSLRPLGESVCFMAEYFLPASRFVDPLPCPFPTSVLSQGDFRDLYLPEWSNALCADRKALDVLGVAAIDEGKIVGLAACSADCETMWQIGIDVLPAYRRRGVAASLTSLLARLIQERGKVPFYCCAWSNIPSARTAISAGFVPGWAELTVKPASSVHRLLGT